MAKKKEIDKVKLSAFPEEVDEASGTKVYGEMSYETQMAVLSHHLHTKRKKMTREEREKFFDAVWEFSSEWNMCISKANFVDFGENFTKIFV